MKKWILLASLFLPLIVLQAQITIPTINTNSWMGDVYDGIKDVKLKEMKLFGSHNALYERNGWANFCDQQGESIASQFLDGARYFDTRIGYDGSFYAFHGDFCSYVYGADTDLQNLKTALDNNPQEVIILEIHKTEGDVQVIANMLYSIFGSMLIESTNAIQLTYGEAIAQGQVVVIFNTNPTAQANAFWPASSITSDWFGTDDNDDLRDWIVGQINTLHYGDFPTNKFWVRQIARSYVFGATESLMSMSEGTNRRFEEAWIDENLWMSKCWGFIKMDWFGYHNHLQKVVKRIGRWYYCTNTLESTVDLPKGYYKIRAKHSNKLLQVTGGGLTNGANIDQWSDVNAFNQHWLLEHVGSGKYLISARHSGKMMEVPGDEMANTANIHQNEARPYHNAYWVLEEVESGYYYIRSLAGGRGLDVAGVSSDNGANIYLYDLVGGDNQKFSIELVTVVEDAPIFKEGEYALEAKHSGKLMEINSTDLGNGATLVQEDCDDAAHQRWHLHYFGLEQYLIEATHSGKVLDGTTSLGNLYQWKRNDSQPQHYEIIDLKNGYFSIKSQYTGQYASVQNGGLNNGDQIVFENWTDGNHQQWRIVDVTNGSCSNCPDDLVLDNMIDGATYQAVNTISATGAVLQTTLFSAGNCVDLLPGFCADPTQNNACFEVQMTGCVE